MLWSKLGVSFSGEPGRKRSLKGDVKNFVFLD